MNKTLGILNEGFTKKYLNEDNIPSYLDSWKSTHPNRVEHTLDILGATLLSTEEYEKYKENIPRISGWYWWLRSPGEHQDLAAAVHYYGSLNDAGYRVRDDDGRARPVLKISNLKDSNLKIKDKFSIGEYTFTIISDNYAICDTSIGEHRFDAKLNDYEKSEIKKYIDNWFNTEIKGKDIILNGGLNDGSNEDNSLSISGATLLSAAEYDKYKKYIPFIFRLWWLRSPGNKESSAAFIIGDDITYIGGEVSRTDIYVRPALIISNLKSTSFKIRDRFSINGYNFTIISDDYAISNDSIGRHIFDLHTNIYKRSEIKQFVDNWFNTKIKGQDINILK